MPSRWLVVDVLQRLRIELSERAGVGEEDRRDAGERPGAEGAGEEQRPDQHVDRTQEVEQPLGDLIGDAAPRDVAGCREGQRESEQAREHRADERHDDGLQSFVQTSRCCHSELLRMLSHASARFDLSGSMRSPEKISETTSPARLPQNGELVSKTKFAQPQKRWRTLTSSSSISTRAGKPKRRRLSCSGAFLLRP